MRYTLKDSSADRILRRHCGLRIVRSAREGGDGDRHGDTRFTDPSNVTATSPLARAALIARIAEERPDAILISGDVPWHGGEKDDYTRFRSETEVWRSRGLRVIPALGDHEFSQCLPEACLENWWTTFPELRGKRWYVAEESPAVCA